MIDICHTVAAEFERADARTAVTVGDIAVIAFLTGVQHAITADFRHTRAVAAVAVGVVAVVAFVKNRGVVVGVHGAVAAVFKDTGSIAAVARGDIAIVALIHHRGVVVGIDPAVSAEFKGTGAGAAVTVSQVAVITFFDAGLHEAIAAGSGYTGAETGIGIINVAIVAGIQHRGVVVDIDHAVTTVLIHTGARAAVTVS